MVGWLIGVWELSRSLCACGDYERDIMTKGTEEDR